MYIYIYIYIYIQLKNTKRTRLPSHGEAATQFSSVTPICGPAAQVHVAPPHPVQSRCPRRHTATTWPRLALNACFPPLRVLPGRPLLRRVVPPGKRPWPPHLPFSLDHGWGCRCRGWGVHREVRSAAAAAGKSRAAPISPSGDGVMDMC